MAMKTKNCRRTNALLVAAMALAGIGAGERGLVAAESLAVGAEKIDQAIRIDVGGKHFTTYLCRPQQKYPYFWPVNGPRSGRSVTTESSEPWPHHHSLFFGCDRVNGWNFWQEANERGQIVSRGPRIVEKGPARVVIEDTCDWRAPGNPPVIEGHRRLVIQAPAADLRLIDFHIRLVPVVDVRIQKSNHALFSARVEPHLSVNSGGRLVNAEGQSGEKATFGKKSPWCDYSGDNKGVVEGIAILDHPANRWFPSPWFTRDYGFFSPTPMNWLPGGELRLPKGEALALRYRVVVHAGNSDEADVAGLFADWKEERF
jgi:hypothetical protein